MLGGDSEEAGGGGARLDDLVDDGPLEDSRLAGVVVDEGDLNRLTDSIGHQLTELGVADDRHTVEGENPVPLDQRVDAGGAGLGEALTDERAGGLDDAIALVDDLDLDAPTDLDQDAERVEGRKILAADRDEPIADLETGRLGRAVDRNRTQRPTIVLEIAVSRSSGSP